MNKRHAEILELLTQYKKMEVSRLSELLGVSQVTIRKDLDALESSGIVIREHGYASLNDSDEINARLAYHYDTKQNIVKMAVESIHDGETVMIESGSCCALLALEIVNTRKDVTIITNSAFIADYIRKSGSCKIILLGGEYQNESQVMVGPMVRACASYFYVDKLFIGTDGFMIETGFTGNDYMRSEAVRDMAKQATKVMVITDSVKFNHKGTCNLIELTLVDTVYTDYKIPEEMESYFIENNIKVIKTKRS